MYLKSCQHALEQKIREAVLPRRKKKRSINKKLIIVLEGGLHLTEEPDGTYLLWDGRDYPAAMPLTRLSAVIARRIMSDSPEGRSLLRSLFAQYDKALQHRGDAVRAEPTPSRNVRKRKPEEKRFRPLARI